MHLMCLGGKRELTEAVRRVPRGVRRALGQQPRPRQCAASGEAMLALLLANHAEARRAVGSASAASLASAARARGCRPSHGPPLRAFMRREPGALGARRDAA